jgi:hypothetical protein
MGEWAGFLLSKAPHRGFYHATLFDDRAIAWNNFSGELSYQQTNDLTSPMAINHPLSRRRFSSLWREKQCGNVKLDAVPQRNQARGQPNQSLGQSNDRACGGDHHDHRHKLRLRKIEALAAAILLHLRLRQQV